MCPSVVLRKMLEDNGYRERLFAGEGLSSNRLEVEWKNMRDAERDSSLRMAGTYQARKAGPRIRGNQYEKDDETQGIDQ